MSLRKLPVVAIGRHPAANARIPESVMARFDPAIRAESTSNEDAATIGIYSPIGDTYYGDGWTSAKMSAILRSVGNRDLTVNINSPGGDVFEGLAIYNLLRAHPAKVTVNVVGLAASAASFIAMAADEINIGRAAFMMIHNAWVIAAGDRNDFKDFADWLAQFDETLADIYSARTGVDAKTVAKLMDAETWMGGQKAVDEGFADDLLAADRVTRKEDDKSADNGVRGAERLLRNEGLSKTVSQRIISEIKSMLSDSVVTDPKPSARDAGVATGEHVLAEIANLLTKIKEVQNG